MIRAIAAVDDQRGIGRDGNTPWHIPADLRYFKEQTQGSVVLMGRRFAELLQAPLPDRRNVIVSKTLAEPRPGFELIRDPIKYLEEARAKNHDIWIIGGGELYTTALPYCEELYITHVRGDFSCDVFFPPYASLFEQVSRTPEQHDGGQDFSFAIYRRKSD